MIVERPDMQVKVNLTREELEKAKEMLGREPNIVELGMIDIMWSEHCSYKSSREVLKILPREGEHVIIGPGQDAGVVDIGNGLAVVFKIESHNHPSAVDPYNGAATGVGGIIRDILCMGARPIALVDSLRFGFPSSPHARWLFRYVVKGIADYGNCTGIPTVAGQVEFDPSFERNCLVNVGCVGIARKDRIMPSVASNPGDVLVLVGGSTGRDGIHGVTFASKTLSEKSEEERSSVQIGDPFMKKLVIEATLEAVETGYVRGLKDLGGGGLTCATSEMAAKGGTGVEIELSKVHLREEGMTPYEIMLSESQERMLFVVDPKGLDKVLSVFEKYEIPYSIIGRVTDTREVVVKLNGKVVARVPAKLLAEAPLAKRTSKKPAYVEKLRDIPPPPMPENLEETLPQLLSSPNIASKEWVYQQYDHEVGIRTVVKPGQADAAVLRIIEEDGGNRGIAIKADCNSRHMYLDPFNGAAGALAECCRNIVAVGGKPLAFVDCANFGNPEKPEIFWQFEMAIKGLAYMARGLGIPCVGGNVSFYNEDETTGRAVKPSTEVLAIGLVEDLKHVTTMAFKSAGDVIVVVGKTFREVGGSEYYYIVHGIEGGKVPAADPNREKSSMNAVLEGIRRGYVTAAHDISRGGFAVALAEMAIQGGRGAEVFLDNMPREPMRIDELLYSESNARFIITVEEKNLDNFISLCRNTGAPFGIIGRVSRSNRLILRYESLVLEYDVHHLEKAWKMPIWEYMEGLRS
ncbi:MAG: phosphoribosylformylglycinamidine synthase subunit PurL [Candidatus Baldrarchaeia archaeon]|mgnify:CR=1 FL=1